MRQGTGDMKERYFSIVNRQVFQISTIWLLAGLVFIGIFANGWTYDDFPVIVENPDIRSLKAFLADAYPGRPLRELTFLLDHALFGFDPTWWHLQQIFWHALNASLVYVLARQLGGERLLAWLAAALFVVHPLQVEVVANISHRKDSLALAFSLSALLSFVRFHSGNRRWMWLTASVCLWAVALSGKLSALCLPAVFLAYEYCCVPRERRFLLKYPLPYLWGAGFVAAGLGAAGWFFAGGGQHLLLEEIRGHFQLKANYFADPDFATYLWMLLKSWAFMFLRYVIPVNLAPEYTYPVPTGWFDPWVLGGIAGGMGLIVLLVCGRQRPLVFIPLALAVVFWLPVSNVWPLAYFAADRYMYGPSAGVVLLFAFLLTRIFRGKALLLGSLVVLATLSCLTVKQVRIWHSPVTLWTHALGVSPNSTFALNNMGNNYLLQGDLDAALALYRRSVAANPTNPEVHYNLGLIYESMGAIGKAIKHYRHFIAMAPRKYAAQVQLLQKRFNLDPAKKSQPRGLRHGQ